jgi:hypothetical protein
LVKADVLELDEVVDYGKAPHAADAACLEAPFFELVVQLGPVVDPDRPRLEGESDPDRHVYVPGENAGVKAIF